MAIKSSLVFLYFFLVMYSCFSFGRNNISVGGFPLLFHKKKVQPEAKMVISKFIIWWQRNFNINIIISSLSPILYLIDVKKKVSQILIYDKLSGETNSGER
jgi:hypothetical protein